MVVPSNECAPKEIFEFRFLLSTLCCCCRLHRNRNGSTIRGRAESDIRTTDSLPFKSNFVFRLRTKSQCKILIEFNGIIWTHTDFSKNERKNANILPRVRRSDVLFYFSRVQRELMGNHYGLMDTLSTHCRVMKFGFSPVRRLLLSSCFVGFVVCCAAPLSLSFVFVIGENLRKESNRQSFVVERYSPCNATQWTKRLDNLRFGLFLGLGSVVSSATANNETAFWDTKAKDLR